jgi:predicted phosphoribosyltransferase
MFKDREDGARQLADRLRDRAFRDPLVLAIPRGGLVTGAILAAELGAELDVVLARKLRAPNQQEAAIGAIAEDGRIYLNPDIREVIGHWAQYLEQERTFQMAEIERRKRLIRRLRPRAQVAGRSVIVTDDGIATGSTMIAALQSIRAQNPYELIVAVPVASPERLARVRRYCDEAVALLAPEDFWAVGQYYEKFGQVGDDEVIELLQPWRRPPAELKSS